MIKSPAHRPPAGGLGRIWGDSAGAQDTLREAEPPPKPWTFCRLRGKLLALLRGAGLAEQRIELRDGVPVARRAPQPELLLHDAARVDAHAVEGPPEAHHEGAVLRANLKLPLSPFGLLDRETGPCARDRGQDRHEPTRLPGHHLRQRRARHEVLELLAAADHRL